MVPVVTSDSRMILIHGVVAITAESNSGALRIYMACEALEARIVMPGPMSQVVYESRVY